MPLTDTGGNSGLRLLTVTTSAGTCIMNYNRRIFETIIETLRRANVGLSINDLKDIVPPPKEEKIDKPPEKKPEKKT